MFYGIRILFLICSNSFFSFWLLMELNTISFLILILFKRFECKETRECINQCFFYFVLQSCVSMIMLLGFRLKNFSFIELSSLISICLVFKIGLFPFYFWMLKLIKYLDPFRIFILLGPQKIYLILLSFLNLDIFILCLFWICLFFGRLFMMKSLDLGELILGSSIRRIIILFFLYSSSLIMFFLFFFIYISCLYFLFANFSFYSYIRRATFLFSSLILLSSPFFPFFLLKFQIFKFLVEFLSTFEFILFWIGLFLCFIGYLTFFFFNFVSFFSFYNSNLKVKFPFLIFFLIFFNFLY